ncbi:hypothetical protein X731_29865 [Mesorhizobium sp. L2C054A000]|nr:hypothetical protein X731_29865 [Mesorhizobium sp. L2C054A000]
MRLPGLDVVLGSGAPAIGILLERLGLGDDEAGIGTLGTDLDPRDNALDAAPTGGAVKELLEAVALFVFADASKRTSVPASRSETACAAAW